MNRLNDLLGSMGYWDGPMLSSLVPDQPGDTGQYPMLLAGNGISFQTQRALNDLERNGHPPDPPPQGTGSYGQDSQMTRDWRDRAKEEQTRQLKELLFQRNELRRRLMSN